MVQGWFRNEIHQDLAKSVVQEELVDSSWTYKTSNLTIFLRGKDAIKAINRDHQSCVILPFRGQPFSKQHRPTLASRSLKDEFTDVFGITVTYTDPISQREKSEIAFTQCGKKYWFNHETCCNRQDFSVPKPSWCPPKRAPKQRMDVQLSVMRWKRISFDEELNDTAWLVCRSLFATVTVLSPGFDTGTWLETPLCKRTLAALVSGTLAKHLVPSYLILYG